MIPFRPALVQWTTAGRRLLESELPEASAILAPKAKEDLEMWLARELSDAASPVLLDGFLEFPQRKSMSPNSRIGYQRYLRHLTKTGLRETMADFPELATVLGTVVLTWSTRVTALVRALAEDAGELEALFGVRLPMRRAAPVGETVVGLQGAAGSPVVYKGRAMDMDVAFNRLLAVLNERGDGPPLCVPRAIDRGDHGWMAHLPQRPPLDHNATLAYWHRVGRLLCTVHALGGGDIHAANIRTVDAHPVIIDGEVLLRPRRAALEDLEPNVLSTGWLPTVLEAERCGMAAFSHGTRTSRWIAPGTDGMRRRSNRSPLRAIRPAIIDGFGRMIATGGLGQVLQGFEATYASICRHGLPLEVFDGSQPRVLLRTSHLYQDAVEDSQAGEALRSVSARQRIFRRLTEKTPPAVIGHAAAAQAVAEAEFLAMSTGQVPRFTVPANGRELRCKGRALGRIFDRSPLERAAAFIGAMDPAACRRQVELTIEVLTAAAEDRLTPTGWRLNPAPYVDLATG